MATHIIIHFTVRSEGLTGSDYGLVVKIGEECTASCGFKFNASSYPLCFSDCARKGMCPWICS